MRIKFGIGVGMVDAVHDAVHSWAHVRRPLGDVRKNEKETLPALVHAKGAMCRITMMEKRLGKKR